MNRIKKTIGIALLAGCLASPAMGPEYFTKYFESAICTTIPSTSKKN
jgi:hypothetical protein